MDKRSYTVYNKSIYVYITNTPTVEFRVQGVAVGDRTHLGIYASKFYGVSQT